MVTQYGALPRFLGPLEVAVDGQAVPPGGPKQQVQLLTLTGVGGVGKIRLVDGAGTPIVERRSWNADRGTPIVERWDQLVFFADLSTVFDESAVDAVLTASAGVQPHSGFGVAGQPGRVSTTPQSSLKRRQREHLSYFVARLLASLVRSCPEITVIATSRAPLHVDGEHEWRTPSLQFSDRPDASVNLLRQPRGLHTSYRASVSSPVIPPSPHTPGTALDTEIGACKETRTPTELAKRIRPHQPCVT